MNYLKSLLFTPMILLMVSCGNNKVETRDIETPNATKNNNKTELPVVVLPTIDGILEDSEINAFKYPQKDTIETDSINNNLIGAYGSAYLVWIGPVGWTGKGLSAADGSVNITLHPLTDSSESGPQVSYIEIPACQGCILDAAAQYFPEALNDYNESYNEDNNNPIKIPDGLLRKYLSSTLITYTLPNKNNLLTYGVVYYMPSSSSEDAYYTEARFILPENETKLAEFLEKNFIKTKGLK